MKSDKELAVEFASSYISAWFSRDIATLKPLDGKMIADLITESYNAIHSLSAEEEK